MDHDEPDDAAAVESQGADIPLTLLGMALLLLSLPFFLTASGALANLVGYQDGATSTYLTFGLPALLGGLILIAAGIRVLVAASRKGRQPRPD